MQAKGKAEGKTLKFKKVLNVSEEVWKEIMRRKIEGGYRTVDDMLKDLLGLTSLQRTASYTETRGTKRASLTLSVPPSRKAAEESERKKSVERLPYEAEVYINNQVPIPAKVVRALRLQNARIACITLEYKGAEIVFNAELLRTRHTVSRQFTIPKSVRDEYGIAPGAWVKVKKIEAVR